MLNFRNGSVPRTGKEIIERKPGIAQVSILFSITIVLFLLVGYRAQEREFYSGILVTEFILIMLPALAYLLMRKYNIKSVLRLNAVKFANYPLVFGIMFFSLPVAAVFNLINLLVVYALFGKLMVQPLPEANNLAGLFLNILIIAGSAALCEEFLFRGVIQRGFEELGAARAILLTAFLFSITHQDMQKVFGTFFLGALIGFIVYRTNSLYCGMFAHFVNNATAVLFSFISETMMKAFPQSVENAVPAGDSIETLFSLISSLPPGQQNMVLIFYSFIILVSLSISLMMLYTLMRLNPVTKTVENAYYPINGAGAGITVVHHRDSLNGNGPDKMGSGKDGGSSGKMWPDSETVKYAGTDADGGENSDICSEVRTETKKHAKTGKKDLLWLVPGIALIFAIYYLQARSFIGSGNRFTDLILRILGVK